MVKELIQGLGGFDGKASSVSAVDLLGLLGTENAKSTVQALIDVIADKVLNQLLSRSNVVNNALTTEEGYALDARMGKSLQDQITAQNSNLEWKYVADVIGSSTINIPSDACEIFVTVTKSSVIYDGVTTLSLLVPVRILSTVYQDFLNGGYGNNDQQTYLAFFRINKYNAHLYALKVAGQDYTATSQLKMWYR